MKKYPKTITAMLTFLFITLSVNTFAGTILNDPSSTGCINENFEKANIPDNAGAVIYGPPVLDSNSIVTAHIYPRYGKDSYVNLGPGLIVNGVGFSSSGYYPSSNLNLTSIQWSGANYYGLTSKSITLISSPNTFIIDFNPPVRSFGFERYPFNSYNYNSISNITIYGSDDVSLLDYISQIELSSGDFFGYEDSNGIGKVVILRTGGGANNIDNVQFCGLNEVKKTCHDILNNAVKPQVTTDGKGMTATFTPNFGFTLKYASSVCGYDHFNFVQWVTYDDDPLRPTYLGVQPPIPYLDPPLGGWDYQLPKGGDDLYAGYWSEVVELPVNTSAYTLSFRDFPYVSSSPYRIKYKTALAGVYQNYQTAVVGNYFKWEVTSVGAQRLNKNLDASLVLIPGLELIGVFPINELNQDDVNLLSNQGIVVINGNQPPTADAGTNQMLECTQPMGTPAILNGSLSIDPDGDPLSYNWTGPFGTAIGESPSVTLPIGISPITLVVNDGQVDSVPDTVTITVQDTTPPNLQHPTNILKECTSPTGQAVALGTATASDACFTNIGIYNNAPALFTVGTTPVTWTAVDESGNTSQVIQSVNIIDTTPPQISITCSPNILWPPNHNMVEIVPTVTASDICDPSLNTKLYQITMNEGDETNSYDPNYDTTTGDGRTLNDIQVTPDGHIYLRSERSGTNTSGRKYVITYKATDDSDNNSSASCEILVPHDMR